MLAKSGVAAKAWVNYYYTGGTPTIYDSYNVSSLTDNGTGDATINFNNNMSDTNYGVAGSAHATTLLGNLDATTPRTTSSVRMTVRDSNTQAVADSPSPIMVIVFGN